MKKGLAVFSGSAIVHKLMQDGTVVLGTALNPAAVTISGSLTASADSILVGDVGGEFTNTTLGGILVELKDSGSADAATAEARLQSVSSSIKDYVDAQDVAVGNAAAAALGDYTASNNTALSTEVAARVAGDIAARAYADQKITDLIGGAPAILDTLNEIAVSLNNSGSLATVLAGQIAQVQSNLDVVSDSLTQEIADRISDVDTEQLRAENAESVLTSAIATEALAREAADSTEQSARQAADTALQSNIDAEAESRAAADSAEQSARIAADQILSSSVDALDVRLDALEAYNGNVVHVDPVGGVDSVGNGTLLKPFRTINYAYSQVTSLGNASNSTYNANVEKFVTDKLVFKLAPGTYTENVVLGFKRARVALVGNGARIVGSVKMDVKKADFPASSLESFKAQYPAPWTGTSAQMSFEIAGDAGGGLESDPTSNVITVTGKTSLEFENGGANFNWDSSYGQFYTSFDSAALAGGFVMIHDNTVATARAPAVVVEVESSKIGNADLGSRTYFGYVPFGANTTVPAYGGLTLKAHNTTFASVIGPTITIGEIDGCRVYDIDRTMGGVVTNGVVNGSSSTSYLGVVNTQFRTITAAAQGGASVYKIGAPTGAVRYKIDSVSHTTLAFNRASTGVLSARTLDLGGGVSFDFLDNAGSQFVSHVPANYAMSGTVSSSLGHLAGIDTALGNATAARIAGDLAVAATSSAALGAYTSSNNAALAQEVVARIAGDTSVRSDLSAALATSSLAASSSLEGVRSDLQGQIDVLAGGDLSGTLSSIADIKSFLDGEAGGVEGILTGFNDLSVAVNAISGALTQEISDRAADVDAEQQRAEGAEADLQDQINSLTTGSTQAVDNLRSDFNSYTGSANVRLDALESDLTAEVIRASGAEATLTSDLAAEVIRATGAESVLTADLASEVSDRAAAVSAEQAARIAGDSANATAISDLAGVVQGNFDLQQSDIDGLRSDVDALTTDLADEVSRAQGVEAELASDIAEVASDLATETANRIADVDAEEARAEAAEAALGVRIDGVEADLATEQARALAAEVVLQSAIDTEKDRIDAILSLSDSDKDSFKEIVELINSVDTTSDTAFAGYVLSNNAAVADVRTVLSSSVTGALTAVSDEASRAMASEGNIRSVLSSSVTGALLAVTAEQDRAMGVEAGLQSQIDGAQITINGITLDPFSGGSLSVVKGASNNLTVVTSSGNVVVDLASSVTLAGNLSAAQLSASAGLSVVGGASVAGGMTVSSGDVEVSHGTIKSVMEGTADATALTALASAAATSDGKFFYLKGSHASWARPDCWYFCQNGDWFDAPFYGEG